jgi:cytochrome oxidase Cu insertion factor (SCO1/SenC/PrrC family)
MSRTWLLLILLALPPSLLAFDYPLAKPQTTSAAGKPAPEFSLKDQDGKEVKLSSFRGQRVLLVFYRAHW